VPTIRNDSPVGDLDVPLLRCVVKAGEDVTVTPDQARRLLPQGIWVAVDKAAKAIQADIDSPVEPTAADDNGPADAEEGATA
jgi:hypothetical protein